MKPGDKVDFKIKIKVADGAPAKKHKISIGISADQIGFESMDESPVPKLRQLVENKNNVSTQVLAAEALAKRDDPVGFQFLKNMATKSNPDMRSRAIRALGRLGNKSTPTFLREFLMEKDGYVRGNTFIALALLKAQTMTLQKGLSDRDPFVKTCALAALTYRGSKTHIKALKSALEDPDKYVQVAAAWGLASIGEKEGLDTLDRSLGAADKDIKLAIFAGEALLSIPDRDVESKPE
jgi:HEAT repeat protein